MSEDSYNGYSNRETWAVALHINNDQGWQESVLYTLREERDRLTVRGEDDGIPERVNGDNLSAWYAGEIIRENVETMLSGEGFESNFSEGCYTVPTEWIGMRNEIGSLWRVNWDELGRLFLEDLES